VNDLPGSSPAGPSNNTRNDGSPVDSAGAASVTNTESYSRRSKIRTRSMSSKESGIHEEISRTYKKLQYQLQDERRRADEAERKLVEVTSMKLGLLLCKMLHKPKRISGKGRTLKRILFCVFIYFIFLHRLYKVQLDRAQKEIYRAQETITIVDQQRHAAEKEATKNRSKARQLNETSLVQAAREEAWRLGLQEGLNQGRNIALAAEPTEVPTPPLTLRWTIPPILKKADPQ